MKFPSTIKIGSLVFEVLEIEDHPLAGEIIYTKGLVIKLNSSLDDQYTVQTLIHEVTHGILDSCGDTKLSGDEEFVTRLSNTWLDSLLGSPGLLEALIEIRDRHTE